MVDLVGHQLGNYRLIRLLKRDAFGDVYLGQHVHVHRLQAAVKLLRANVRSEYQELFLQEAETIAGLRHPHIIRILDFGIDRDSAPYLIMDYTSQETLRSRHPKGSIVSLMTVIAYVKQIAEALQYIHDHHVVHRDLQPGSLIVGDNGDILLSDFGFSIAAERLEEQGEGEMFMVGLTSWPPPEQMMGQACFASDQYALVGHLSIT